MKTPNTVISFAMGVEPTVLATFMALPGVARCANDAHRPTTATRMGTMVNVSTFFSSSDV